MCHCVSLFRVSQQARWVALHCHAKVIVFIVGSWFARLSFLYTLIVYTCIARVHLARE